MISIRYRYVGQGDCIILECDEAPDQIGFIDCNTRGCPENRAVTYLKTRNPAEVAFVLMTHPHADHYTGLRDILEYCEHTSTPIQLFGHTAYTSRQFLEAAANVPADRRELIKLFGTVKRLKQNGLIARVGRINDMTSAVPFGTSSSLAFLAPRDEEFSTYEAQAYRKGLDKSTSANPNLLSLVTRLDIPDGYALFTADAERTVLTAIEDRLNDNHLVTGQIPHHGSNKNYPPKFWRRRSQSHLSQPLAISVGPNPHGHPSAKVIQSATKLGYTVVSTWMPAGRITTSRSLALDLVSRRTQDKHPSAEDVVIRCSRGSSNIEAGSIRR